MVCFDQFVKQRKEKGKRVYFCDLCGAEFRLYRKCVHHVVVCLEDFKK